MKLSKKRITKVLTRLQGCAGWSAPMLFANPGRQFFPCRGPNSVVLLLNTLNRGDGVFCCIN